MPYITNRHTLTTEKLPWNCYAKDEVRGENTEISTHTPMSKRICPVYINRVTLHQAACCTSLKKELI
jgi:hypothetical protein